MKMSQYEKEVSELGLDTVMLDVILKERNRLENKNE